MQYHPALLCTTKSCMLYVLSWCSCIKCPAYYGCVCFSPLYCFIGSMTTSKMVDDFKKRTLLNVAVYTCPCVLSWLLCCLKEGRHEKVKNNGYHLQ